MTPGKATRLQPPPERRHDQMTNQNRKPEKSLNRRDRPIRPCCIIDWEGEALQSHVDFVRVLSGDKGRSTRIRLLLFTCYRCRRQDDIERQPTANHPDTTWEGQP